MIILNELDIEKIGNNRNNICKIIMSRRLSF